MGYQAALLGVRAAARASPPALTPACLAVSTYCSSASPVASFATCTALAMGLPGRFSPWGPIMLPVCGLLDQIGRHRRPGSGSALCRVGQGLSHFHVCRPAGADGVQRPPGGNIRLMAEVASGTPISVLFGSVSVYFEKEKSI